MVWSKTCTLAKLEILWRNFWRWLTRIMFPTGQWKAVFRSTPTSSCLQIENHRPSHHMPTTLWASQAHLAQPPIDHHRRNPHWQRKGVAAARRVGTKPVVSVVRRQSPQRHRLNTNATSLHVVCRQMLGDHHWREHTCSGIWRDMCSVGHYASDSYCKAINDCHRQYHNSWLKSCGNDLLNLQSIRQKSTLFESFYCLVPKVKDLSTWLVSSKYSQKLKITFAFLLTLKRVSWLSPSL